MASTSKIDVESRICQNINTELPNREYFGEKLIDGSPKSGTYQCYFCEDEYIGLHRSHKHSLKEHSDELERLGCENELKDVLPFRPVRVPAMGNFDAPVKEQKLGCNYCMKITFSTVATLGQHLFGNAPCRGYAKHLKEAAEPRSKRVKKTVSRKEQSTTSTTRTVTDAFGTTTTTSKEVVNLTETEQCEIIDLTGSDDELDDGSESDVEMDDYDEAGDEADADVDVSMT
jgi:hypothetical protein